MTAVRDIKFKPHKADKLFRVLDGVMAETRKKRLIRDLLTTAVLVAVAVISFAVFQLAGAPDDSDIFGIPVAILLLVAALGYGGRAVVHRKNDKVEFTKELLASLREELMPGKRVRMRLDLRFYEHDTKLFWTGESQFGNPKAKYSDKWLAFEGTLAEGSTVAVRRQAGIKTKSESIMREKRRLFLTVEPNPNRYQLERMDMAQLKRGLKSAVGQLFHDPPEKFHFRPELHSGRLKIKVTQLDAPILAEEVMVVLQCVFSFLAEYQRTGPYR